MPDRRLYTHERNMGRNAILLGSRRISARDYCHIARVLENRGVFFFNITSM